MTCTVQGAETEEQAEQMAKAVVRSPLVSAPCSAATPTGGECCRHRLFRGGI